MVEYGRGNMKIKEWVQLTNDWFKKNSVKDSSDIIWEKGVDGVRAFLANQQPISGGGVIGGLFYGYAFVVTWEGTDNLEMENSDFYRVSQWSRSGISGKLTESTTLAGSVLLRNAVQQTFNVNRESIEVFEDEYIVLKTTFSETEILDCVFEVYELEDIPLNSEDIIYTQIARIDAEHVITQILNPSAGIVFTWRIGIY